MRGSNLLASIVTLLFAITIGCKNDTNLPLVRTKLKPDSSGIIRDMPEDKKWEYSQLMRHKHDSSLGLLPLQNGFKGLQIRVLYGTGTWYENRLFLVEHNRKGWKGELYHYRDSFEQKYAGATLIEKIELKQSHRQWQELVGELFHLGIDTLPDYTQLPNYHLDADGDGIMVEVAQDAFYKIYSYPTPEDRDVKEAKQIMRIKSLIEKKFGNKLSNRFNNG